MSLSRIEQETIISFNEDEKQANVYTCNPALKRKLAGLAESRPEDCKLLREYPDGIGAEYQIPKRWVKVNPSRILTDEQRAILSERGKAMASSFNQPSKNPCSEG